MPCFSAALTRRRARRAFSLVEVVLAIGIVAVAFVPLFGMIPFGLTNFRKAMDASTGSRISQQVLADLQQTSFDQLTANPDSSGRTILPLRYFDDQGNLLGDATSPQKDLSQAIYQVKVVIQAPCSALVASDSNLKSLNLANVLVDVVKNPGNTTLREDAATGGVLQEAARGIFVSRYFSFMSQAP